MSKIKKKYLVILVSIIVAILVFTAYQKKNDWLYGDTQDLYMSSCLQSLQKSFPMSRQKLYVSCECSYNKFSVMLGMKLMTDFSEILLEKDANKTNNFLMKKNIDTQKLDSYLMSCL